MENTLVIIKPSAIQRELIGKIISRLERKGLKLIGLKMIQLTDSILNEHYSHLVNKSFFNQLKDAMKITPVIVCCFQGIESVKVVRELIGTTNGRNAQPGTIRGDYSMSGQENIVHASDSPENALIEINRFFKQDEIFTFTRSNEHFIYAADEA